MTIAILRDLLFWPAIIHMGLLLWWLIILALLLWLWLAPDSVAIL